MRIDAIAVGKNPPKEINVIVEVPVGGEPIKKAGKWVKVLGWGDAAEAERMILEGIERAKK
jgi:inorganic pyrophosphatase